jgi:hypothetical protein
MNQENEIIVYCTSATGTQCPAYGYTQNVTTGPPTTIYDGNDANVKIVIMQDDSGDRRYVGEWETDTAEGGIYHVDIVASGY